jgi:hypothetical protein
VIYSVVSPLLVDDLYEPLVAHYANDPDVTVIVDRRSRERREPRSTAGYQRERGAGRELRDRRRRRPGSLPELTSGD